MYADGDTGVVPRSNMFPMVRRLCEMYAILISLYLFAFLLGLFGVGCSCDDHG